MKGKIMKNPVVKIALTSLVAVLLIASCKNAALDTTGQSASVQPTSDFVSTPSPVAANDNSANGIYKGVITDTVTTGSFWVSVTDDTATPSVISRAGVALPAKKASLNVRLTTAAGTDQKTVTGTVQSITNYQLSFTWTTNSISYAMTYTVSPAGVISTTTPPSLTAGGAPIAINLAKETTSVSVESWVGTISGSSSGTTGGQAWTGTTNGNWNFIRTGNTLSGSWNTNTVNSLKAMGVPDVISTGSISGTVSGNTITFGAGVPDKTCTGTFSGSSVGGSWSWISTDKGSGSWSGAKKL
jgi:hypothetical protein